MLPDAVVFAHSTEEVAAFVKLCSQYDTPIIPYGAGTSLEGHVLALQGGVTVDLSQMNQVLAVNAEDLTATVQAGVTRKQLNQEIKDTGLFFPIDPGADASLGGMASTRASGTNAVRYGTMKENTLTLTVVTAQGEIIKTGTRAKKSSAGYDLTRVYVGSEGTLGIITEVTVRLYPQPEAISAAICSFPSVADAVNTVIQTIQMGVPLARVELLDENGVRAINAHDKLNLPVNPCCSSNSMAARTASRSRPSWSRTSPRIPCTRFRMGHPPRRPHPSLDRPSQRLLRAAATAPRCARDFHRLLRADLAPGRMRAGHQGRLRRTGLIHAIIGHVGDGNFHVQMMVDPNDPADIARAEGVNARMVARALGMDGTCTGEHGVGLHKMDFLIQEHGDGAIAVMRAIKHALDPKNIMNPGKILRWEQ
jgi:D-lactate dehydrogenase (cytochrome)